MIVAGRNFLSAEADDVRTSTLTMARLGSELALVFHNVIDQPLPPRLQTLVDALDRSIGERDRSRDDEVTLVRPVRRF